MTAHSPHRSFRQGGSLAPPLGAGTLLILLLLLCSPGEARAREGSSRPSLSAVSIQAPTLLAEEGRWSIGAIFSSLNNRTRVIQFCFVILAIGLFIMMKKFAGGQSPPRCQGAGFASGQSSPTQKVNEGEGR